MSQNGTLSIKASPDFISFKVLINENGFTARAKKYKINYLDSIMGDVYTDNKLDVYDVIRTSDIIFENQFLEKYDLNDDGLITEEDINVLLNFIFN